MNYICHATRLDGVQNYRYPFTGTEALIKVQVQRGALASQHIILSLYVYIDLLIY